MNENKDFAQNAKFKTAKCTGYLYFTINEDKQIRIYKTNKTTANQIKYRVCLHSISEDKLTFLPYEKNEGAISLTEAKEIAGKFYFETIRQ